jgi:transposase
MDLIEEIGCKLLYLPPYSPDFNSVEEAFAKVKGSLGRFGARTYEPLVEAMGRALATVTARDVPWFVRALRLSRGASIANDKRFSYSGVSQPS